MRSFQNRTNVIHQTKRSIRLINLLNLQAKYYSWNTALLSRAATRCRLLKLDEFNRCCFVRQAKNIDLKNYTSPSRHLIYFLCNYHWIHNSLNHNQMLQHDLLNLYTILYNRLEGDSKEYVNYFVFYLWLFIKSYL